MPFPFGKSHKSPADIVKNLKDSMSVLEKHVLSDKKAEKVGSHHLLKSHCCLRGPVLNSLLSAPGYGGGVEKPGGHEGDPVWHQ